MSAPFFLVGVMVGGAAYLAGIVLWSWYDERRFRRRFYGEERSVEPACVDGEDRLY